MSERWLKLETVAKKIVILIILAGAALALFMLTPAIISLFLPFVAAYIISIMALPLTVLFEKIKLPSALSAIISILVVAAALFGLSFAIIAKIAAELYEFSLTMPDLYKAFSDGFSQLKIAAVDIFNLLPDEFDPYISSGIQSIFSSLSQLSSVMVEFISTAVISLVKHIPGMLIAVIFSVLSSYFLIRDKKIIKKGLSSFLGDNITSKIREIRAYLHEAVFAYAKAQGILISITFVEVFVGLSLLKIKYSFLFALVIALVDAIPVLGTGTILLPWALYHLIIGNYSTTIGLCLIYGVCLIVRQFLEPKILSSQIGVHPLVTLVSLYIGYRFLGVFGMILGYIVTLMAKNFVLKYKENH